MRCEIKHSKHYICTCMRLGVCAKTSDCISSVYMNFKIHVCVKYVNSSISLFSEYPKTNDGTPEKTTYQSNDKTSPQKCTLSCSRLRQTPRPLIKFPYIAFLLVYVILDLLGKIYIFFLLETWGSLWNIQWIDSDRKDDLHTVPVV